MDKKWVFDQIVKNEEDFVGLFAYALYKSEKSKKASTVRESGKTEAEIKNALDDFHNTAASSQRLLNSYRSDANKVLSGFTSQFEDTVKKEYEDKLNTETNKLNNQIKKLNNDLKKSPKKAEIALIKKVSQIPRTTSPLVMFFSWLWSWTVSGFASIWAAFVALGIVYLFAITVTAPENRKNLLTGLSETIVLTLSESPVPEVSFDDAQGSVSVTVKNPLEPSEYVYVEENTKSNISHVNNKQLAATKKSKPQG